jgi:hypothetical protein
MITFGSDGASVMTGAIGGVVALIIMRFCAFMVAVHCICHRLALASADAADAMDFSDKWEKLMNTTFSFFSRSTDRTQAHTSFQCRLVRFPRINRDNQEQKRSKITILDSKYNP